MSLVCCDWTSWRQRWVARHRRPVDCKKRRAAQVLRTLKRIMPTATGKTIQLSCPCHPRLRRAPGDWDHFWTVISACARMWRNRNESRHDCRTLHDSPGAREL